LYFSALVVAAGLLPATIIHRQTQNPTFQSSREDAYRANNIGVALLEQFNYKEAAAQFRQALKLEPSLALARVNLGIALYNLPDPKAPFANLRQLLMSCLLHRKFITCSG
jgi:tetratricopeptide (TPR) repeat protein